MFGSNIVSISLGDNAINLIVGRQSNKKVIVSKYYSITVPDDIIRNGDIINEEELTALVQKKIKEFRLSGYKATVVFQSSLSIHRESILPYVKGNDLETMVQYELEQYLPMVLEDYIVQFKVLEYFRDETGEKQRVLVSAIPTSIVEKYYNFLKAVDLIPNVLDTSSNAIQKILSFGVPFKGVELYNNKSVALIGFGYNVTTIDIFKNCVTGFIRKIPIGGNNITNDLAERLRISYEEAERLKTKNCYLSDEERKDIQSDFLSEFKDIASNSEASTVLQDIYAELMREIQSNLNFYSSRTKTEVDYIYIFGGGAKQSGIEEYMTNYFHIPVKRITAMNNVRIKKEYQDGFMSSISTIGAIIRK